MLPVLLTATLAMTQTRLDVSDFGVRANAQDDATAGVAKAIAAVGDRPCTLVFSKGDYHFHRAHAQQRDLFLSNSDVVNPRAISVLIEGKHNLRIEGNGARFLFHDRVMPFAVLGSQHIEISGVTVDWERPLMSQGLVVQSGTDGFTLRIDQKAYPYEVRGNRLHFRDVTWDRTPWAFMEFDPATRGVAANTGDADFTDGSWGQSKVTESEPGLVRFEYKCTRYPKVGHIMVARHGVRDHAGTFILDSKDVRLTDVAFRHTSGLGVLCQYSEDLTFKRVEVAPDAHSERMFAGHDDGLHLSNCRGHIEVDSCKFEGLMDDPINVHGTSVRVIERKGETLRCRFMHDQSIGLRFGDVGNDVSFIDHESMIPGGRAKIASIRHFDEREFELTFDGTVPSALHAGDALENLSWTPSFTVRNTHFGRVRARGLLVSTPKKVVIEGCIFESSGAAILIPGDANYWFESGAVHDVTIRHNRFENCNSSAYQFGDAVISIHPEIPRPGPTAFHRNIRIEDNDFIVFDSPVLWALSVDGLRFERNRIRSSNAFEPRMKGESALSLIGCRNVSVAHNELIGTLPSTSYRVSGGDPQSISVEGFKHRPD